MIADQLRYFCVAARHQHLGRAAEELEMSQPALSRSILKLEQEYGVNFFDRMGRGVRLNANGRILFRRVERAIAELEDAARELAELRTEASQSIAIGFLATMGARLIPTLIRDFRASNPDAQFRLLQGPFPLLRERLLAGEVDLCISAPGFAHTSLQWQPLFDEQLSVIVPAEHPLAQRGSINLEEIAHEPIVTMKSGYGLRQILDDCCRLAGFQPQIAFEAEEVSTVYGLVGAGFGVGLAPAAREGTENQCVSLNVRSPPCHRTVGISWRNGRFLSSSATGFRNYLLAVFSQPPSEIRLSVVK